MYLIEGETNYVRRCLAVGTLIKVRRSPQLKVNLAHVVKRPTDWNPHRAHIHPFQGKLLSDVPQRVLHS
jgi:hypothetical protein